LLVANTGDDEEQSLKELIPIGAPQLLSHPELWVDAAGIGLPLLDSYKTWWKQALKGLVDARPISLESYSEYVAATREAISNQGQPMFLVYCVPRRM
jgi:S-DNA-T family DNA segregation ATPase FtsK/SpoIIIE